MQVLKVRLRNLIASRIKLREKFDALGGLYISKEVTTNSTDEAFLDWATKVVVDHIDQSDFGLDVLLSELSVRPFNLFPEDFFHNRAFANPVYTIYQVKICC